jgi:hypothetical protein
MSTSPLYYYFDGDCIPHGPVTTLWPGSAYSILLAI